jgi:hypothetical protein
MLLALATGLSDRAAGRCVFEAGSAPRITSRSRMPRGFIARSRALVLLARLGVADLQRSIVPKTFPRVHLGTSQTVEGCRDRVSVHVIGTKLLSPATSSVSDLWRTSCSHLPLSIGAENLRSIHLQFIAVCCNGRHYGLCGEIVLTNIQGSRVVTYGRCFVRSGRSVGGSTDD